MKKSTELHRPSKANAVRGAIAVGAVFLLGMTSCGDRAGYAIVLGSMAPVSNDGDGAIADSEPAPSGDDVSNDPDGAAEDSGHGPPDNSVSNEPDGAADDAGHSVVGNGLLCAPCARRSDCIEGFCLISKTGEKFCGRDCASRSDCAWGSAC